MFERYTEKARRVIFFARYEAAQLGSPFIETEHLLLGLLREDKWVLREFLPPDVSVDSLRTRIAGETGVRKGDLSVDLPLSNECKRVLAYAAEEAERLAHRHIGTEHLFLGLLREQNCNAAELLREFGVSLEAVRTRLAQPLTTTNAESQIEANLDVQLGRVIAQRILFSAKLNAEITVLIGLPRKSTGDEFITPYQILGVGERKIRYVAGADAVESLQRVFPMIARELADYDARWAGGADPGFSQTN